MKKTLFAAILALAAIITPAGAQSLDIGMEARGNVLVGPTDSHFYTDYLNLKAGGYLSEHFSFNWRQRFTKPLVGSQPLNATDMLTLTYHINDWEITAGKEPLECGGFEYDAPPIDLHYTTECYNNINCYQYSFAAARIMGPYKLIAQASRSPFATMDDPASNGLKAFSLALRGTYGRKWLPMYSLNLFEAAPGAYSFQFSLGNRVQFGHTAFEFDLINRSAPGQLTLFKDYSFIAYMSTIPAEWAEIMVKATFDTNDTDWADPLVAMGFRQLKVGSGVYLFPLKEDKSLRFHCYVYHAGAMFVQAGITIKTSLLKR